MPKDLRTWIEDVERLAPGELLRIEKEISPRFEVLALITHLEQRGQGPAFLFENILNLKGERSEFPLLVNAHASRTKLGVTFGLSPEEVRRRPGLPQVQEELLAGREPLGLGVEGRICVRGRSPMEKSEATRKETEGGA